MHVILYTTLEVEMLNVYLYNKYLKV